jgi:hypothetical protein
VAPVSATLVTIAGPPEARPADGLAVGFVVIGKVATLDDAVAAFNPTERIKGKTIIRVRP